MDTETLDEGLKSLGIFPEDATCLTSEERFIINQVKNRECVYFVLAHAGSDAFIKIGYSSRIRSRLSGIKSSCPFPITLIFAAVGNRHLERILHEHFKDFHLRGEWFNFAGRCVSDISDSHDFVGHVDDLRAKFLGLGSVLKAGIRGF